MSNNEVKYSITGGSLATTNHAHYDSFRIPFLLSYSVYDLDFFIIFRFWAVR